MFKQFGKTRIESSLSNQFRLNIEKQNENDRSNRAITQMIKAMYFLGKQESDWVPWSQ